MAELRPFRGVRPPKDLVLKVACPPYDVVNAKEARAYSKGNPQSFFNVSRPEVSLPEEIDEHDDKVYAAGKKNLAAFLEKGTIPDKYRPTLWDFLAFDALSFYSAGEQAGAKPEDAFEIDPDEVQRCGRDAPPSERPDVALAALAVVEEPRCAEREHSIPPVRLTGDRSVAAGEPFVDPEACTVPANAKQRRRPDHVHEHEPGVVEARGAIG